MWLAPVSVATRRRRCDRVAVAARASRPPAPTVPLNTATTASVLRATTSETPNAWGMMTSGFVGAKPRKVRPRCRAPQRRADPTMMPFAGYSTPREYGRSKSSQREFCAAGTSTRGAADSDRPVANALDNGKHAYPRDLVARRVTMALTLNALGGGSPAPRSSDRERLMPRHLDRSSAVYLHESRPACATVVPQSKSDSQRF